MTSEEKFVVNPLERYFLDPSRSGARWRVKARPKFGTSATNWDLQIERHGQVLLIEAKYIRRAFAASMAGLIISPLSMKREFMKRKSLEKSAHFAICWAMGSGYEKIDKYQMRDMYQILFDYIARNPRFWRCYSRELKVKYIYFVHKGKVARIRFMQLIGFAEQYRSFLDKSLSSRRTKAVELLKNLHWA